MAALPIAGVLDPLAVADSVSMPRAHFSCSAGPSGHLPLVGRVRLRHPHCGVSPCPATSRRARRGRIPLALPSGTIVRESPVHEIPVS